MSQCLRLSRTGTCLGRTLGPCELVQLGALVLGGSEAMFRDQKDHSENLVGCSLVLSHIAGYDQKTCRNLISYDPVEQYS